MDKNDQKQQKGPESAADVIKDAQNELGKERDLQDAPPTAELIDAKNRLVEAAREARTRASSEYPFMVYDTEGRQPPRKVNSDEEYNDAIDNGFDDKPAQATVHGLGDETEQQRIKADARVEAEKERAREQARKDLEQADQQREKDRGGSGGSKGKR